MSKVLRLPRGQVRIVPTTTIKLAQRMLAAAATVADHLPYGCMDSPSLAILLKLYVDEESALYPRVEDLNPPGSTSSAITGRWVSALEEFGLVERQGGLLALTSSGYACVTHLLEDLYTV